ncbi:MAG: hypothetical protein Q9221_002058 [Calogaya cf. arnoldii]
MLKCKKAAVILTRLMNPNPVTNDQNMNLVWTDQQKSSASVGDKIIVADEKFTEGQELHTHSWNIFISIEMRFPATPLRKSLVSTHYLQMSGPTFKTNQTMFDEYGRPVYDSVQIVSGVCLFNENVWKASLSGSVHPSVLKTAPTTSEVEYVARSSTAIADVASMLVLRLRERSPEVKVRISLDVPSFHYYHNVVDMFERGVCTSDEALTWMDLVDSRHDQVAQVFTGLVRHELVRRGVSAVECEINTPPKYNPVSSLIRKALQHGVVPRLEETLLGLSDDKDGLFRSFYPLVPVRERPQDLKDLGNLFYVYEAVKPALLGAQTRPATRMRASDDLDPSRGTHATAKPRRLIIGIDDPAERRIYSKAQVILKKIRSSALGVSRPDLMEVYLCRKVFVNGNKSRADLWNNDPMPTIPVIAPSSEQESEEECPIEPLDIVHRLYGAGIAYRLQALITEAGL